jgi:hypothetical protein
MREKKRGKKIQEIGKQEERLEEQMRGKKKRESLEKRGRIWNLYDTSIIKSQSRFPY